MIFQKKSEKKGFPILLAATVGALAVIGAMSIKNKSCSMVNDAVNKVKTVLRKKTENPLMNDFECEF